MRHGKRNDELQQSSARPAGTTSIPVGGNRPLSAMDPSDPPARPPVTDKAHAQHASDTVEQVGSFAYDYFLLLRSILSLLIVPRLVNGRTALMHLFQNAEMYVSSTMSCLRYTYLVCLIVGHSSYRLSS